MKTNFIILLLAITVSLLSACGGKGKEAENQSPEVKAEAGIQVKMATAETVIHSEPVIASGFISSASEARLAFKTGGVIERIYVAEGDMVTKGQLLAGLNLTEINAMVQQAKQGMEKAERDLKRAENLYKDTVATLEQFQNAQTGYQVAKQNYEMARFNLSYSEIRATANGRIVRKLMNEGEITGPGTPVFFMNATGNNDWLVKVGVADKDWAQLKVGDRATVQIDAYPDQAFTAIVSQLSQGADPTNSLYQIQLKLQPGKAAFATGLFAKVKIQPARSVELISIPVEAINEGDGRSAFVFVVENGKALRKPVTVSYMDKTKVYLREGIAPGEQVVAEGSAYLTNGSSVTIVQ